MTEEEAKDILFKIKKDNESKAMIIHNNSSNIQISWSNKDLEDMARIQQRCANNVRAIDIILNELDSKDTEINKLNNVIDRIKNYTYQEVAHITEDIKDYIDDDKEGNKNIIGEFKETREQWKDIMRIIEGKADTDLYVNWKEWGEYE